MQDHLMAFGILIAFVSCTCGVGLLIERYPNVRLYALSAACIAILYLLALGIVRRYA